MKTFMYQEMCSFLSDGKLSSEASIWKIPPMNSECVYVFLLSKNCLL